MDDLDPQTIAAARRGDLHAFETIVRRFQSAVFRICYQLVQDETLAEDVVQDSFVRIYRFLPNYRGDSRFSTWLFSIARNCAMDEMRRASRRSRVAQKIRNQPSRTAAEASTRAEVHDALARLPIELREPVVWIDMVGLPYAEVAAMLKVPVGTLKSRVHRARQVLFDALYPELERSREN